ncbi:unnamed protein product [Protopolystoma xenopodis]|uniref:Uncharacterized protein n=1 Tax=Protopolystoma xenopodis TaxID=117903 RepID=A0A448WRR6_9PLAT|nr:unnamed protein product [Protopolystoma xenopodis]
MTSIAEARLLRQHKGRLEARMQMLEEHNRQLESQLSRLRRYLATTSSIGPQTTLSTSTGRVGSAGSARTEELMEQIPLPIDATRLVR